MNTVNNNTDSDYEPGPIARWFDRGSSSSLRRFFINLYLAQLKTPVGLICWYLWIAASISVGAYVWRRSGQSFGIWGFCTTTVLSLTFALICMWSVRQSWLRVFYPFPTCRKGSCCKFNDYTWPWPTIYGWIGWRTYVYYCNCGDQYVRRGKRFTQMLPGDKAVPYKQLTGFRTWGDDTAPVEPDRDYSD